MRRSLPALLLAAAGILSGAVRAGELELAYSALELPGAPAQLIPVEIDGDPGPELAIVVVYTAWENFAVEETSEMDGVSGLVAMMTIVPALMENRELWLFDRGPDGRWTSLAEPMELAADVLSLEATGHPGVPLLALTDAGADAVRLDDAEPAALRREPVVEHPTAIAGSRTFLPRSRWVHALDTDAWPDLILPTPRGWRIHRGDASGFETEPTDVLTSPEFDDTTTPWRRDIGLPQVRDVDGDALADLVIPHPLDGLETFFLFRNLGEGRFGEPIGPLGTPEAPAGEDSQPDSIVFFDDLDGDARAEYVSQAEIEVDDDAGMRKEMAHAKEPPHRYRILDVEEDTFEAGVERLEFVTEGYSFPGESDVELPGGLWDLDGDGRRDLVTLTLDFSMLQAVRILVTKSLSIGLDFHVLCQREDGSFRKVTGLDLSGRFKMNLNNFRQGQLSLFNGDFDGDGRKDFVQIGRGKEVSIHRGSPGCRFPTEPDLVIELVDAPEDLALVDVVDLDGDGLSDLSVVQLQGRGRDGQSPPVRLDLYTSGGVR